MREFEKLIDAVSRGSLEEVKALVENHPELVDQRDELGATPLHFAAFGGHRAVAQFLIQHGAEVNALDGKHGATPAGWAIEYLREMGGFLEIELRDFAHSLQTGDVPWARRFLNRFPNLREANDSQGNPFRLLANKSGNPEIVKLFEG